MRKLRTPKVKYSLFKIHIASENLDSIPVLFLLLCIGPSPLVSRQNQIKTGKWESRLTSKSWPHWEGLEGMGERNGAGKFPRLGVRGDFRKFLTPTTNPALFHLFPHLCESPIALQQGRVSFITWHAEASRSSRILEAQQGTGLFQAPSGLLTPGRWSGSSFVSPLPLEYVSWALRCPQSLSRNFLGVPPPEY